MKTIEEIQTLIDNSHPLKTKRHDLWALSMELVGQREAKGDFVELVNALLARVEALEDALQEIAHPVKRMEANLQPGEKLNGGMAVRLANDPVYLRGIARRVLGEQA